MRKNAKLSIAVVWLFVLLTSCTLTDDHLKDTSAPAQTMTAIDLPAMFTPNGDGQDDVLTCLLPVPGEVEFTVYDRWGQVMFRTTDPAIRWNGETNGVAAPPGMYFYQLMLAGNNPVEQKGNVLLLR